jgi:hypothetical protein
MRYFGRSEAQYGYAQYKICQNNIELFSSFGNYIVVVDFSIIHKNKEYDINLKTFGNNSEAVIL